MKEIFKKIDVENSEVVKKNDLQAMLKTFGKELNSEEYKFAAQASDEAF
jgi:Ca2+-binding EF-hand superfamily protein